MIEPTSSGIRLVSAILAVLGWPFRFRFSVRVLNRLSSRLLNLCVRLGRRRTEIRLAEGRPRAMWGVTPIVTLPLKVRANALLGIRAESVVWTTYIITRNFTWNLRWCAALVQRLNPELLIPFGRVVLAVALLRYDVFHFFNDRGLTWPTRRLGLEPDELDALRRAGKRTYVFVYGADIRTRNATLALGRWNFCSDCPEPGRFCICDDERGARQQAETSARVNAVVSMADMTAYTPGSWNFDYWPIDLAALTNADPPPARGSLVIAHAPNHMHFKGTRYLEQAISELQAEGHDIVLSRVSGVPNSEVMRLFGEADVVADQFIGGTFGYTALEAMALGKPLLSYVRSRDIVAAPEQCPIMQSRPETIRDVLLWCIANKDKLAAIGAQGAVYVRRHHCIEAVAGRFAQLYRATGDFPAELNARWQDFVDAEARRRAAIPDVPEWWHPFRVSDLAESEKRFLA